MPKEEPHKENGALRGEENREREREWNVLQHFREKENKENFFSCETYIRGFIIVFGEF